MLAAVEEALAGLPFAAAKYNGGCEVAIGWARNGGDLAMIAQEMSDEKEV